jgi:hypothetical protein
LLQDGWVNAKKIDELAEPYSISSMTLRRAADELKVLKRQRGLGWWWSLPKKKDA